MTEPRMRAIDRYVPKPDFRERHLLPVLAPPARLLAAAAAYRPEDDPFFRRMIGVREWPMRLGRSLLRREGEPPPPFGIDNFTLLERDDTEIVYGLAGRFWAWDYGLLPVDDAAHFRALCEAGSAKLALNFAVEQASDGGAILSTETRIACVDQSARRAFTPYWYLIRPVSGLIRRRILGAIRDASETTPQA
jgi:hypothetical protein